MQSLIVDGTGRQDWETLVEQYGVPKGERIESDTSFDHSDDDEFTFDLLKESATARNEILRTHPRGFKSWDASGPWKKVHLQNRSPEMLSHPDELEWYRKWTYPMNV